MMLKQHQIKSCSPLRSPPPSSSHLERVKKHSNSLLRSCFHQHVEALKQMILRFHWHLLIQVRSKQVHDGIRDPDSPEILRHIEPCLALDAVSNLVDGDEACVLYCHDVADEERVLHLACLRDDPNSLLVQPPAMQHTAKHVWLVLVGVALMAGELGGRAQPRVVLGDSDSPHASVLDVETLIPTPSRHPFPSCLSAASLNGCPWRGDKRLRQLGRRVAAGPKPTNGCLTSFTSTTIVEYVLATGFKNCRSAGVTSHSS
mmetsp:Transcript_5443/g.19153  ORF Transcript_5443/g.19153 Transcript_5443/m.19153 type:complete len:259 (-) Transcript_5443:174-950(-)